MFLIIFIVLITSFLVYLRHRFTYWRRHGVPGPNYVEWKGYFRYHHEWSLESIRKYGRVYGSYAFNRKLIVINDPDLLRDICVKDFHIFPDHKRYHLGSSKIDKSLFFMPGDEEWKRVRSILSPAFTSGKLKAMMSHISDISDKFVNNLSAFEEKGGVVDIRKYVGAFAMDVISTCAYGINVDSINNPEHPIVVNAKKILGFEGNLSQFLCLLAPGLAKVLGCEIFDLKAVNYFDELTNEILKERKKFNKYSVGDKSKRRTDFVQLMLDSEKSDKDQAYYSESDGDESNDQDHKSDKPIGVLSQDELTAQGILFFIAGYDTTSAAISHAIYYLSQNIECQNRLYSELRTVTEFSYERLNELKYLNAVISETLRLAPSLTRVQRECKQDYKLGQTGDIDEYIIMNLTMDISHYLGITIPAGTCVEISPYALHRDAKYWPEPEQFKPERFIDSTHHPYAYIPFGDGPRICIGQRFALNEMRMCIAKLIHRYRFTLNPGYNVEYFKGNLLMSPKELIVNLKAR